MFNSIAGLFWFNHYYLFYSTLHELLTASLIKYVQNWTPSTNWQDKRISRKHKFIKRRCVFITTNTTLPHSSVYSYMNMWISYKTCQCHSFGDRLPSSCVNTVAVNHIAVHCSCNICYTQLYCFNIYIHI